MFDELNLLIGESFRKFGATRLRLIKVKATLPSSKKRATYFEFRKGYLNFRNYAKYPKLDFTQCQWCI